MGGECVVFWGWPAYGGRAFAKGSRGVLVGVAWYLRGMGGECLVFAGWPAYGGRAFAEGSRGVRVGVAWYLQGMGGVYGRGMRGIGSDRTARRSQNHTPHQQQQATLQGVATEAAAGGANPPATSTNIRGRAARRMPSRPNMWAEARSQVDQRRGNKTKASFGPS